MEELKRIDRFPSGVITPPPSKSYAHRALICAALAAQSGDSRIKPVSDSEDMIATMSAMRRFGAMGTKIGDEALVSCLPADEIAQARQSRQLIDCGESGSTLRFLIPLAAVDGYETAFTGHGRLPTRPLEIYRTLFAQKQVVFVQTGNQIIVKGKLPSGLYELAGDVSSQFLSGLLLALPLLSGDSVIKLTTPLESSSYVDMTIDVLKRYGVKIARPDDRTFAVQGDQRYQATDYHVEPDFSQAAYYLGAAALGLPVSLEGMNPNSLQGDIEMLKLLEQMGADVEVTDERISVKASALRGIEIDAREIPDIVPPLAALCALAEGKSRIYNAQRLRIKESDRLHAISTELNKLGAKVTELRDGLEIEGVKELKGGCTDAHNDHRIAMSIAMAAIRTRGEVWLSGAGSVRKSYPNFWKDFEKAERPEGLLG